MMSPYQNQLLEKKKLNLYLLKKGGNFPYQKKKFFLKKYDELKDKYPKKGKRDFAKLLEVPYSCLLKWINQRNFIEMIPKKKNKSRLEGEGDIHLLYELNKI